VDIVAVAVTDNRIHLHNLKLDVTLMKFQTLATPVSLAFRQDGPPMLICGDSEGGITAWNLDSEHFLILIIQSQP